MKTQNKYYITKIKMFEEFNIDYNLQNTIEQLYTRAESWREKYFSDAFNYKVSKTETEISTEKNITVYYDDSENSFKRVITVTLKEPKKCKVEVVKYNPSPDGYENNPVRKIWEIDNVTEVQGPLILDKIKEIKSLSKNPDKRKIDVPEEEEPETPPTEQPPAEGAPAEGAPPAQGGPAQGGAPPAQEQPPAL